MTVIVMALTAIAGHAAITAEQVLGKVASALTKPASVTVTFAYSGNGQTGNGNMTVCRRLFTYNAGDLTVWYDGKTQWALARSAKEVSVTEPEESELIESNPFMIISNYKNLYTAKLMSAPKGYYKIALTAKSRRAAVRTAVLTVNATTFIPTLIEATMGQNVKTTIHVKSFSKGKALPQSYFRFSSGQHKDIKVNDLR